MSSKPKDSNNTQKPDRSLVAAIRDSISVSKSYAEEVAEAVIDLNMSDGLLKEIPIVGWITRAFHIRDAFYIKRLRRNAKAFLESAGSINDNEAERLNTKFKEDPEAYDEFVDMIVAVHLESMRPQKLIVVGNLVGALSSGVLSFEQFSELVEMCHMATLKSLKALASFMEANPDGKKGSAFGFDGEGTMFSAGFVQRYGSSITVVDSAMLIWKYGLNEGKNKL